MGKLDQYSSLEEKKDHFKSHRVVRTKEDFLLLIDDLKKLSEQNKQKYLFRGVNESKFKLYSSFQRLWIQRSLSEIGLDSKERISTMINHCKDHKCLLHKYFKRLGVVINDWLILSFLQHYGAASPLIDFSKKYSIALFFACDNVKYLMSETEIDNYISIYYYRTVDVANEITPSIYKLATKFASTKTALQGKEFWDDLSFSEVMKDKDTVIVPSYANESKIRNKAKNQLTTYTIANLNSTAQEGEFVCNATPDKPLEDLWINNGRRYIHCVDIHKGLVDYIIHTCLPGETIEDARKIYYPMERDIADKAQREILYDI